MGVQLAKHHKDMWDTLTPEQKREILEGYGFKDFRPIDEVWPVEAGPVDTAPAPDPTGKPPIDWTQINRSFA